jgi:hypothetical protein
MLKLRILPPANSNPLCEMLPTADQGTALDDFVNMIATTASSGDEPCSRRNLRWGSTLI